MHLFLFSTSVTVWLSDADHARELMSLATHFLHTDTPCAAHWLATACVAPWQAVPLLEVQAGGARRTGLWVERRIGWEGGQRVDAGWHCQAGLQGLLDPVGCWTAHEEQQRVCVCDHCLPLQTAEEGQVLLLQQRLWLRSVTACWTASHGRGRRWMWCGAPTG